MFGTPDPISQHSLTLELTSTGDSFAIQLILYSQKCISLSPTWLKAWNIYLAIMVAHKPSKASELIAYQSIITSASRQYPIQAWLNYNT